MREMPKIAWVSRHPPLPAQIKELERIFGEFELIQIAKVFRDAKEVIEDVKKAGCTHAVVVVPLSMVAHLVKDKSITWIRADMYALHECEKGKCKEFDEKRDVWLPLHGSKLGRHMRFNKFQRIVDVVMVLEDL